MTTTEIRTALTTLQSQAAAMLLEINRLVEALTPNELCNVTPPRIEDRKDLRVVAKEIVGHLTRDGFEGASLPEVAECDEENWDHDYAIIHNFYTEAPCDSNYFESSRLMRDLEEHVAVLVSKACNEPVVIVRSDGTRSPERGGMHIQVQFHKTDEVEFIRRFQ